MNKFFKEKINLEGLIGHIQKVKKSDVLKDLERRIETFSELGIESPYTNFLLEVYDKFYDSINKESSKDYRQIGYFLHFLKNIQKAGLGRLYFPLNYELVFLENSKDIPKEITKHTLIGGWALFNYLILLLGLEESIRNFRGSHDLDIIAFHNYFKNLVSSLYPQAETIETHLDKYSSYLTDDAIKYEEIENTLYNYNNLAKILKENNINMKEIKEEEFINYYLNPELFDKLKVEINSIKGKIPRNIENYIEKNFYLNWIRNFNLVNLDKLGRLELDLYLPKNDKIFLGEKAYNVDEIELYKTKFGPYDIYLPSPRFLIESKLKANRDKDIKDLILLAYAVDNMSKVKRKKLNLKDFLYYARGFENELYKAFKNYEKIVKDENLSNYLKVLLKKLKS